MKRFAGAWILAGWAVFCGCDDGGSGAGGDTDATTGDATLDGDVSPDAWRPRRIDRGVNDARVVDAAPVDDARPRVDAAPSDDAARPTDGAPPPTDGTPPPTDGAPPPPDGAPNADVGPAPDAAPPALDGSPPTPDAEPPGPDGAPPLDDAAPPPPDGAPPVPDAAPPPRDGAPPVPDAAPEPDAAPPVLDAAPPILDAAPQVCDVDPDCAPDAEGRATGCDLRTHECVALVPCCGGPNVCQMRLPIECAAPAAGARDCAARDVCAPRCPGGDADCAADAWCDADAICRPGCRVGGCDPDEMCDLVDRVCGVAPPPVCNNDAQCVVQHAPGWYCVAGNCLPPCNRHEDCRANAACNFATHRCVVGACRDDAFEDNDRQADATPLVLQDGRYDSGAGALGACSRDRDWYQFETPAAGWSVRVTLRFTHANGDLDAVLYDPDGRVAARGESATDDEVLIYPGNLPEEAPAGTWQLEVYSRGLESNAYGLLVELTPPQGCFDFEEGDDTPDGATRLPLPQLQDQQIVNDRAVCVGDEDWFSIPMGARDGLDISLTVLGNGTGRNEDIVFELHGPGAPAEGAPPTFEPNAFSVDGDGNPVIAWRAARNNFAILDGLYFVRVFGFDARQNAAYRLRVAVDRETVPCLDDASEPNEVRGDAFDLMGVAALVQPGGGGPELIPDRDLTLADRTLCRGDVDWYRLVLADEDDLDAWVVRRGQGVGVFDVALVDENGVTVGRAIEDGVRARGTPPGAYFLRVGGDAQGAYDLHLQRSPRPEVCVNDAYEPNDDDEDAAAVDLGITEGLRICGEVGDVDYFLFETEVQSHLTVAIRFAHRQANLDLAVYLDGRLISEEGDGASLTDDEVIVLRNRPAAQYVVEVHGVGAGVATYDLEVTAEPVQFLCPPDPDEPNDDLADATYIGDSPLQRVDQWICEEIPPDVDVFAFDVPPNTDRLVAARFTFGDDGDLALEVYDQDEVLRATTAPLARGNGKQCVEIVAAGQWRSFSVAVVPLAINSVIEEDQRLDYELLMRDGDDCETILPEAPAMSWPRVRD